ncbi:hypothetical protein KHA94_01650 [Bacillus sp. FJAT-49705]|uniref:Uncharacterized protein n=1 Tax=Cytobacillus citreus TaxID=2833586 RepID=A0ABS5NM72_9BACI|nr:hypothetical protein [Cytobacillus citreus]MBS4188923.1 hypothetical protein [Cytobacillus citreus]
MIWFMLCAIYNLVFGVFHLIFWKLLVWKVELKRVSPNNRAVMQTLNLCLTFTFFLIAYLYIFHTDEMGTTSIGKAIRYGVLLFWIMRTILQIMLFNLKKRVHQILLVIFLAGVVIHLAAIVNL